MHTKIKDEMATIAEKIYDKHARKYLAKLLCMKKSKVFLPAFRVEYGDEGESVIEGTNGAKATFWILGSDEVGLFPAIILYLETMIESVVDIHEDLLHDSTFLEVTIAQSIFHELAHYSIQYYTVLRNSESEINRYKTDTNPTDAAAEEVYCDKVAFDYMRRFNEDDKYQVACDIQEAMGLLTNMELFDDKVFTKKALSERSDIIDRTIKTVDRYRDTMRRQSIRKKYTNKLRRIDGEYQKNHRGQIVLEPKKPY